MNNNLMFVYPIGLHLAWVQNVQIISDTLNLKGPNFFFHVSAYINFLIHAPLNQFTVEMKYDSKQKICVNYFSDMSFVDFNSAICNIVHSNFWGLSISSGVEIRWALGPVALKKEIWWGPPKCSDQGPANGPWKCCLILIPDV